MSRSSSTLLHGIVHVDYHISHRTPLQISWLRVNHISGWNNHRNIPSNSRRFLSTLPWSHHLRMLTSTFGRSCHRMAQRSAIPTGAAVLVDVAMRKGCVLSAWFSPSDNPSKTGGWLKKYVQLKEMIRSGCFWKMKNWRNCFGIVFFKSQNDTYKTSGHATCTRNDG